MHNAEQKRPVKNLPKTVDEAVKRLISDLPLKDKAAIANLAENDLATLQFSLGTYIGREFGIWSGNRKLLDSCEFVSGDIYLHPDFAPTVIIVELWNRFATCPHTHNHTPLCFWSYRSFRILEKV